MDIRTEELHWYLGFNNTLIPKAESSQFATHDVLLKRSPHPETEYV